MDTWTEPMYALMATSSPFAFAYCIAIAILGGFFVVNLFLAVIFNEFMTALSVEEVRTDALSSPSTPRPSLTHITPFPSRTHAVPRRHARPPSPGRQITDEEFSRGASDPKPEIYPNARVTADDVTADGAVEVNVALLDGLPLSDGAERSTASKASCCDCTPRGGCRAALAAFVASSGFGNASTALVLINLGVMCMGYATMSKEYAEGLEFVSTVITLIFMGEMALKLIGLGCGAYWADGWNKVHSAARTRPSRSYSCARSLT